MEKIKVTIQFTKENYEKICKDALKANRSPEELIQQRSFQLLHRRQKDKSNAATAIEVLNGITELESDVLTGQSKTQLIKDINNLKERTTRWQR